MPNHDAPPPTCVVSGSIDTRSRGKYTDLRKHTKAVIGRYGICRVFCQILRAMHVTPGVSILYTIWSKIWVSCPARRMGRREELQHLHQHVQWTSPEGTHEGGEQVDRAPGAEQWEIDIGGTWFFVDCLISAICLFSRYYK